MKLIHYPTYVQCPICKKPFKTDLYLRRHIISSHEAQRYNFEGTHVDHRITNNKDGGSYRNNRDSQSYAMSLM